MKAKAPPATIPPIITTIITTMTTIIAPDMSMRIRLLASDPRLLSLSGPAGHHPLDDAELRPLIALDLESLVGEVVERLAGEMVRLEAEREWLDRALDRSDR
jgi:hypothetical protein